MTEEEQRYLNTFTGGIKPIHIPDNYVFDSSKGGYVLPNNTGGISSIPVNIQKTIENTPSASFSADPATTLTPLQQLAEATQSKIADVGLDTYKTKGEYNVRFDDGTSLFDQDLLDQYGVSKKEFASALTGYGNYIGSVGNRLSAGSGFELGLENILNPEEAQEQFEAETYRKRKEKRQKERTDATRQKLDTQVGKEAIALFPDLNYSDAVERYYELPFSQRASMAASDISEIYKGDNSGLGVLGSESLAAAQKKAEDYFNEPVEAFFNIPDVSGAVDDPDYGKGVYTPPDDDETGSTYDDLDGALLNLPADALNFEKSGFTIPGTNITITAPEGDMRSNGGYGGGAGSGSGDQYGTRPKFGAFANISGGGGGGIWDRFRNSYLTKYGLEGETAEMDEVKVRYDPETNVYFYPDGTAINPADLEGLNISNTFEEEIGTERFKL
tara:strand:+ start:233 stop:1561 length:1329 start_codon:yes stop_codon:yes gene_type:complete